MDSGELIELFYNRAYEKFVNKQILDDKNFIVPRRQLINYVHELVNIPFIDFIDYIKHNEIDKRLEPSDITQFSSFSSCEMEMCKALLWANNPGCKYVDIGRFFPNKLISKSETAYWRYGEIHIKASIQLGLTFEYYSYWYLSCLGYIYPELEENLRMQLLARTITRNRLYQQLLIDILNHDVNPEEYINIFPNYNFKRCLRSVYYYLNICLDICRKEGIKVHNLIKRYEPPQEIIKNDNPLETNERIDKYLLEIGRQEWLFAEEKAMLAQKIRRGDIDARNKLVSANMRFVVGLAKQYLHKGIEFEDLLHEGFLGLIRAVELFDETRGFKLINYASWWIKRYLSDAIITDSTLIRYPLNVRILHKRVKDFKVRYEHQYGFIPPASEIDIGDVDNHEIITFLYSLPNNLKNTCTPYEDLDVFEDSHNDIWDYEDNENNKYYVRNLLAHLSKKERDILIRIFGIGVREETLESIGDTFGLTRERVRQVKEKAIKKLRDMMSTALTERQIVESICAQDKDSTEQNMTTKDVEETQTLRDVRKAFKQYRSTKICLSEAQNWKATGNNIVILPSETSKENLSKDAALTNRSYTVINYGGKCNIYDYRKKRVYSSTGCVKEINKSFYRMSLTFTFFSIGLIKKNINGDLFNGNKIILANQHSSLHHKLKGKDYLELIEDVNHIGRMVKVAGCWFDENGNEVIEITEPDTNIIEHQEATKEPVTENKKRKLKDQQSTQGTTSAQEEVKKQITLTYNTHLFKWNVGDRVSLRTLFSSQILIEGSPFYVFRRNILFIFMNNETRGRIRYYDNNNYLISTDTYNFEANMLRKYGKKKPRILIFLYDNHKTVRFFDDVIIQSVRRDYIVFKSMLLVGQ